MTEWKPLHAWPVSARILLTLFLALIGTGYLAALLNLYHQHSLADGREGLTFDDLRAVFHGIEAPSDDPPDAESVVAESRMYEMVKTGGKMRKKLNNGGPGAVRALEAWLRGGATEEQFQQASLVTEGDPTPASVIEFQCLDCHNADTGEKDDAPYGPDMFTVDYAMIFKYAAPGTARAISEAVDDSPAPSRIGPNTISHLALVTHIHMLSIPVFTLIVSGLYLLAGGRSALRGVITVLPMTCLVFDFASWWLARGSEVFLYVMPVAGALYGLGTAFQLLGVTLALWRKGGGQPEVQ